MTISPVPPPTSEPTNSASPGPSTAPAPCTRPTTNAVGCGAETRLCRVETTLTPGSENLCIWFASSSGPPGSASHEHLSQPFLRLKKHPPHVLPHAHPFTLSSRSRIPTCTSRRPTDVLHSASLPVLNSLPPISLLRQRPPETDHQICPLWAHNSETQNVPQTALDNSPRKQHPASPGPEFRRQTLHTPDENLPPNRNSPHTPRLPSRDSSRRLADRAPVVAFTPTFASPRHLLTLEAPRLKALTRPAS